MAFSYLCNQLKENLTNKDKKSNDEINLIKNNEAKENEELLVIKDNHI